MTDNMTSPNIDISSWDTGINVTALRVTSYNPLEVLYSNLCGPVVWVPGYISRGPGFDSRRYQIFWGVVGLERGPLSLVKITEELLE
jgi:hypothetical protein